MIIPFLLPSDVVLQKWIMFLRCLRTKSQTLSSFPSGNVPNSNIASWNFWRRWGQCWKCLTFLDCLSFESLIYCDFYCLVSRYWRCVVAWDFDIVSVLVSTSFGLKLCGCPNNVTSRLSWAGYWNAHQFAPLQTTTESNLRAI